MGIQIECRMPDLSGLDRLSNCLMVKVLIGTPGLSKKTGLYRRYFISLVEKALTDYNEARSCILKQNDKTKSQEEVPGETDIHPYILEFTNHIESCINTISRLFKQIEKIKAEKEFPAIPGELQKLIEGKSVARIRNTIERIDAMVQNGELFPGNLAMIALSDDGESVTAATNRIKFADLAMILKKMHELALYILGIRKTCIQ